MTRELARRIEQNDLDYTLSRLGDMQLASGNPLKVDVRSFGNARAFLIQAWPDFWYGNRVLGLEPESAGYLEQIVDFFHQRNLDFRFEIVPGNLNSTLASRLHGLGFCQMGFSAALIGSPQQTTLSPISKQITVRQIHPDEIDLFLDLYQDGFELPRLKSEERRAVRFWLEHAKAGLYLCMAHVNASPAAVAIMYVKDGIGLFADASTLPAFRGMGCHAALINDQLAYAAERNCDLLTSFVEFGSVSHRNHERAGLRVAYTKALWWKVE